VIGPEAQTNSCADVSMPLPAEPDFSAMGAEQREQALPDRVPSARSTASNNSTPNHS
jgi:hypothetical protein